MTSTHGLEVVADPAGSGPLAERDKVPSRKKIKILDLTRRRTDDVLRKEKAMMPKRKPQWFRHDQGDARELKSQLEWKMSPIVRQRFTVLERKVAVLEKRLHNVDRGLKADTALLPIRVRGIILDALKPLPPLPPTKTLTIYKDNIKTRRPRKKG